MPKVIVNEAICKGCELCVSVCPQKLITLSDKFNSKSYHYACFDLSSEERCNSCTMCALICPDVAIEVYR